MMLHSSVQSCREGVPFQFSSNLKGLFLPQGLKSGSSSTQQVITVTEQSTLVHMERKQGEVNLLLYRASSLLKR